MILQEKKNYIEEPLYDKNGITYGSRVTYYDNEDYKHVEIYDINNIIRKETVFLSEDDPFTVIYDEYGNIIEDKEDDDFIIPENIDVNSLLDKQILQAKIKTKTTLTPLKSKNKQLYNQNVVKDFSSIIDSIDDIMEEKPEPETSLDDLEDIEENVDVTSKTLEKDQDVKETTSIKKTPNVKETIFDLLDDLPKTQVETSIPDKIPKKKQKISKAKKKKNQAIEKEKKLLAEKLKENKTVKIITIGDENDSGEFAGILNDFDSLEIDFK